MPPAPVLLVLFGPPASGKSKAVTSYVNTNLPVGFKHIVIDPDETRYKIPEYAASLKTLFAEYEPYFKYAATHSCGHKDTPKLQEFATKQDALLKATGQQVNNITDTLTTLCLTNKANFSIEVNGNSKNLWYIDTIDKAIKNGFEVHIVYVFMTDVKKLFCNAKMRALKEFRYTSAAYVATIFEQAREMFGVLLKRFKHKRSVKFALYCKSSNTKYTFAHHDNVSDAYLACKNKSLEL